MMTEFSTIPIFLELAADPGRRKLVRPLIERYGSPGDVEKFDTYRRELQASGVPAWRTEPAALALVVTSIDQAVLRSHGGDGAFGGIWKDIARGISDAFTGGAAEAWWSREKIGTGIKEIGEWLHDEAGPHLRSAIQQSWSTFSAAVEDTFRNLNVKNIRSVRDVLDLVKVIATGGVSLAGDAAMDLAQNVIMELVNPWLRKAAEWVGYHYAKAKDNIRGALENWLKEHHVRRVVRNALSEIFGQIFDVLAGYPICLCEEGCIKPVADGLARAGNPYVKIVGQVLKIIYPIVQGTTQKSPETSPALYLYAGGGVQLLPSPDLNAGAIKAVGKLVSVMSEKGGKSFAMGIPQSFDRYHPWLVDLIAIDHHKLPGPKVLGVRGMSPGWYFEHPEQAQEVIKQSEKITGWLKGLDKYLVWINRAIAAGEVAYDIYQAYETGSLKFDVKKWAGDTKALAARHKAELEAFAKKAASSYKSAMQAGQTAARAANSLISSANEIAQVVAGAKIPQAASKVAAGSQKGFAIAERVPGTIAKQKEEYARRRDEAKAWLQKNGLMQTGLSGFGASSPVSLPEAVAGEWMAARLGLEARAKWNDMALLWLQSSGTERKRWANYGDAEKRWSTQATDWKRWHSLFSTSRKMAHVEKVQAAHEAPLEVLASPVESKKAGIEPAIAEAALQARGETLGIPKPITTPAGKIANINFAAVVKRNAEILRQVQAWAVLYQNWLKAKKAGAKAEPPQLGTQKPATTNIAPWLLGAAGVLVIAGIARRN